MENELPLNRKERFYTGTVFPMIVCRDNFRFFSQLTSLIDGFEEQPIITNPEQANIQFFTEYSLVESIYGSRRAEERFRAPPKSKDTPDIVILIQGKKKILIALEAKMYDTPNTEALNKQMWRQTEILCFIHDRLGVDHVYHYALLPEQLSSQMPGLAYPVITWQALHNRFAAAAGEDYFLSILSLALNSYDDLVAQRMALGPYAEGKLKGSDIVARHRSGDHSYQIMGRELGLSGERLQEDITGGGWEEQLYEVSLKSVPPNRNSVGSLI